MSKLFIETRISSKLDVITTQIEALSRFGKSIPLMHIDMLKDNIVALYEQVCLLEKKQERVLMVHDSIITPTEKEAEIDEQKVKDLAHTNIVKKETKDTVPDLFSMISASEKQKIEEKPTDIFGKTDEVFTVEVSTEKEPANADIFSSLQNISETLQSSDINTMLGVSVKTNVAEVAAKQSVSLKNAIGINEKFLFINELFKGNVREYTDTIISLNDATDMENCKEIIDPLKHKYGWEDNSIAFSTLNNFLSRKFN